MKISLLLSLTIYFYLSLAKDLRRSFSLSKRKLSIFNKNLGFAAVSSVDVSLEQQNSIYYVSIELLEENPDGNESQASPITVNMLLGLYTSNTLLTTNCLGFSNYTYCNYYPPQPWSDLPINKNFPYFTGTGFNARVPIYLDDSYWNLQSNLTIAHSCISNEYLTYGQGAYGIIGMGIAGDSLNNYLSPPYFSIYLEKDRISGQLLFEFDDTKASLSGPIINLVADENWHINISNVMIEDYAINFNASLIFDLNADGIGFPLNLYLRVINALQSTGTLSNCSNNTIFPVCSSNGEIDDLPNVLLQSGNVTIQINPKIYVQNGYNKNNNQITLNFKALDSSLFGSSYITAEYSNYVILDSNFLIYYYAAFNGTGDNKTISLYLATSHRETSRLIIFFGVFILVLFGCFCCYFRFRARLKKLRIYAREERNLNSTCYNSLRNSLIEEQG